ncbi:hypothetical protein [Paraeggerthella sp. Marseille-Q4926]|uniref:hypothetical protein n=1 Tax=Paraeggerthella sp. Marseille-Q4926 TaxID=2866587 RepID=UPI001CE42AC5|nr:hypothetical protein [Paraeggerthella sp. Marseille-Q4926]
MMCRDTYFSDILRADKLLKTHGFDRWPTEEEIILYLFEMNDRIDAICSFVGVETSKDIRGRWIVRNAEQEVIH